MAKKKRTIPEVLWRLHGPNARTLADTIIHLLPPRPSSSFDCRCKGRRCLGCNQEDDISFLIRCEDPFDYRTLLNDCFVVVCENAPKITVFYPDGRWSQNEIVTRTIEMIMSDSCASPNVICNGYNKASIYTLLALIYRVGCTRTSSVVDLLTTSAWSLLLSRIGDDAMVHLLRFSSVFLPLRRGNHHQVSGSPISDSLSISSKRVIGSACHHPLYVEAGPSKKRKIIDNRDPIRSKLNGELPHSSDSTKAKSIKSVRPCSWQRRRKCRKTNSAEKTVLSSHISTGQNLEELNGEKPQRSNADVYYHAKNVLLFDESAEQQNPNAQANKVSL
ncbi:hypothetical protein GIB67_032422 [Kingdonia uniflora]|uniref:Telomerase reverse transcriptase n=1 Tax=Kingdonia uniflora TaxID=39325 RepID=A0A7J7MJ37_9MAGN|nr:hypothetical protein GIB67_032422 [Kingdonia uniflora]